MSCQYSFVLLLLCGFSALTVSEICKAELLEGTSCTIKLPTKHRDKSNEITWVHLSGDAVIHRKNGKMKKSYPGLKMEEDGSLTFERVSLKNVGNYKYTVYNAEGAQIDAGEEEIKVYAKAPKLTLTMTIDCKDVNAVLFCDAGGRTDLTVSWYKEGRIIPNEKSPKVLLSSDQVQENKTYSCSVSNPVSSEQSDSVTVTCTGATGESSGPRKLFGFDFWIMVSMVILVQEPFCCCSYVFFCSLTNARSTKKMRESSG